MRVFKRLSCPILEAWAAASLSLDMGREAPSALMVLAIPKSCFAQPGHLVNAESDLWCGGQELGARVLFSEALDPALRASTPVACGVPSSFLTSAPNAHPKLLNIKISLTTATLVVFLADRAAATT